MIRDNEIIKLLKKISLQLEEISLVQRQIRQDMEGLYRDLIELKGQVHTDPENSLNSPSLGALLN